ncbi:MAG: DUF6174 domain-containing protein [candidate division KSB1 bacterium]|nr:DUF6174 domain-containing protein [candidate division KSB1 bacterium]MDZ7366389.1 DUF6174 domain-containing protein [candidate division KSB1 bacterium]MDZ7404044.1 DUF6174 domain-containing protein [candidate division KSB1 bacterium]
MKNQLRLMIGSIGLFILCVACEHDQLQDYSFLRDAQARWKACNFRNYSIEQKRICFCAFRHGFVRLTIKNNKIVEGVDLTNQQPLPQETLQYYQTVDEVFAWIEETKAMKPARLEVEYDARFGYPKKIAFDYSEGVADDELWIEMQALKRLGE